MKSHYYHLNFFRVVAALAVLLCHARCELFSTYIHLEEGSQNVFTQLFFRAVSFGQEAVICFFILSGFLVGGGTSVKLNDRLRTNQDTNSLLKQFVWGRIIRIYPPLMASIVLVTIARYYREEAISAAEIIGNLLGLQGTLSSDYGWVFWTLAYEIWFYVLIASVIALFCSRRLQLLGIVLLFISGCVFLSLQSSWLFILVLGILGYYIKDYVPRTKWVVICSMTLMTVFSTLSHLSSESRVLTLPLNGMMNPEIAKWGFALMLSILVGFLSKQEPNGRLTWWMENFGNRWAPITYCLYITHFAVLRLVRVVIGGQMTNVSIGTLAVYLLVCLFCVVFASGFYWLFEKRPFEFLKRWNP